MMPLEQACVIAAIWRLGVGWQLWRRQGCPDAMARGMIGGAWG